MPINRKITITERQNAAEIRSLFNVGPAITAENISTNSTFGLAENSTVIKKFIKTTTSDLGTLPTITQTYEFSKTNSTDSLSDWSTFVSNNLVTNVPSDHFTNIEGFYDLNDAANLSLTQQTYIANVNYEYNFLIEAFEKTIQAPFFDEKILPNMYAIMYAKTEEDIGSQTRIFNNIVTLNNTLNATETYSIQKKALTNKSPQGEYHDLFAKTLKKIQNRRIIVNTKNITNVMRNIVVPPEQLKAINEMSAYKELYPMYSEINITMDKFSGFSTLLRDSNLTLSLINYVINSPPQLGSFAYSEQVVEYAVGSVLNPTTKNNVSTKVLNTYNIYDWWQKTKDDFTPSETNNDNTLILGIDDETKKITEKGYEFARALSYLIFYGKLRKLAALTQRNFDQTISAEPAYSEAVFYKVTKHRTGSAIPIQTFWIPNSAEMDTFQFIDTQVKYNTSYDYKISSFAIVIGSGISTANMGTSAAGSSFIATLDYTTTPVVTLVEIPVYNVTNKIIDDPPLPPEILVIPSKNINNKIKFFFNNSTGEEVAPFYQINSDEAASNKVINTMFTSLPNDKIRFKSDDIASFFEVFRLNSKPTSYSSFENNRIANVATDYNLNTPVKASSASFIDTIAPNTKYYYTFRTIDFHGHISNPTDVYEIQMVDNDGAIYLQTNMLSIKDFKENKIGKKVLKKLFYIKPEILQTFVNEAMVEKYGMTKADDIYGLGSPNILGVAEMPVWNKSFKLRFISKKTGKMFDLNLNLEVEIDKENL